MAFFLRTSKSIADMISSAEKCEEVTHLPSKVLPCHNLTIKQIFEDFYYRGIIHSSGKPGGYDSDDPDAEPTETHEPEFEELISTTPSETKNPETKNPETKNPEIPPISQIDEVTSSE